MTTYEYPALLTQQTTDSPPLVLFAAPCTDIEAWAGIPQKKRFSEGVTDETVGFQREENPTRIDSLEKFFADHSNVVQNSILCSARTLDPGVIYFDSPGVQSDARSRVGILRISPPRLHELSMVELLGLVRSYIEDRVPELKNRQPSGALLDKLKQQANDAGHVTAAVLEDDAVPVLEQNGTLEGEDAGTDATGALFEETHISDFWEEIAGRHEVCKLLPKEAQVQLNDFLGFSRDALTAYVQPVIVVDGQHRLKGAVQQARHSLSSSPWKEKILHGVQTGEDADAINARVLKEAARYLPVSLLLTDSAAEQVFQFVVVNQKATPIGRALLGTIVSTTLSQNELEGVAERLKNAGIELEESRSISFLARDRSSPFYGKIQRGIDDNAKELLEWNVLGQLVAIFRNLSGGKLFGESNDYADIWRKRLLDSSGVVADFATKGHETAFAHWSSLTGPWREVFVRFWEAVRDKLADDSDPEAKNAWGSPRNSNLFNKITLTILAADFFQFLVETRSTIDSSAHVRALVQEWLTDVRPSYFSRDWKLEGVKKDSTGIKRQWAYLWKEYRKDPRLPPIAAFRVARGG